MKTINITILVLCFCLYFGIHDTQAQSSTIIGFDVNNVNLEDTSYIVAFDYLSEEHDTLAMITPEIRICNGCTAFDHFRKKFYYFSCSVGFGGPDNIEFKVIDMIQLTRESLFSMESFSPIGFEYDFFTNSLILRTPDSILMYDLSNAQFSNSFVVPQSEAVLINAFPQAYNIYSRQCFYEARLLPDNECHYVLADITANACSIPTWAEELHIAMIAPDIFSNKFWGMSRDSLNIYSIVNIDPDNGHTYVCPRPDDYKSHYNWQKAVYDPYRNTYLLPYYTELSQNKLAKINVNSGQYLVIDFIPRIDFGFLNYDIQPILHLTNNHLIASVSDIYMWYRNDTLINGAITRTHQPTATGYYKFSTLDYQGSIVFSNEVYVEETAGFEAIYNIENDMKIFPNPASSSLYLSLNNKKKSPFKYLIMNSSGSEVQYGEITDEKNRINISDLIPGLYIISVLNNESVTSRKFVKID